jgi:hypothetical protein
LVVGQDNHILLLVVVPLHKERRDIVDIVDAASELALLAKVVDTDEQSLPLTGTVGVLEGVALRCTMSELLGNVRWRRGVVLLAVLVTGSCERIPISVKASRRRVRGRWRAVVLLLRWWLMVLLISTATAVSAIALALLVTVIWLLLLVPSIPSLAWRRTWRRSVVVAAAISSTTSISAAAAAITSSSSAVVAVMVLRTVVSLTGVAASVRHCKVDQSPLMSGLHKVVLFQVPARV